MTRGDRFAAAVDRILDLAEKTLIGGLSLIALGLGTMQVVLRYVFNTGFEWNEAVFILCTVAAMLMAGARAVRENAHVRVDLIHLLVPANTGRAFDVLAYAISFLLCVFYVYCGYLYVSFAKAIDTASPETGIKDWLVFSIMPIAMALFSIRYILKIRAALLGKEPRDGHAPRSEARTGESA